MIDFLFICAVVLLLLWSVVFFLLRHTFFGLDD